MPAPSLFPIDLKCPAVQFVGVRGSGEKKEDADGYGNTVNAVREEVLARFPEANSVPIDYPAIKVLEGGLFYYGSAYRNSINDGENKLASFLNAFQTRCGSAKIVLVGFSQGAQVAADVYQSVKPAVRGMIVALALFGDPGSTPSRPPSISEIMILP